VTLDEPECWALVRAARHGVLATVHPRRGVDAVPVVYAVVDGRDDRGLDDCGQDDCGQDDHGQDDRLIVVPVDTVKPKRHLALGRLANLAADQRAVLLVEHYGDDWSELWWVRVHVQAVTSGRRREDPAPSWLLALARRYPEYRTAGTIAAVVALRPTAITGWAARPTRPGSRIDP
jgi:Pyridoxamine 5'-phosphate oxidase